MKYVTISDIAKALNLSKSTVSRALHGDFMNVSPEIQELVRSKAKEMGFRPNISAANLRSLLDMDISIRKVTIDDASELLNIYAPYVEQTAITFEYDVPTLAEFQERIRLISKKYPYLVAVNGNRIVGYAYASEFKGRAAYQWSVETSIYLDMNVRHHGVGKTLYAELERQLKAQGILNMNACITYMDEPDEHLPLDSISFHSTMGFVRCAHFHQIGYKFGKWYDMIWMEKMIGEHKSGEYV